MAGGVTSSNSEDNNSSDNEANPKMAKFLAFKRWFETPTSDKDSVARLKLFSTSKTTTIMTQPVALLYSIVLKRYPPT